MKDDRYVELTTLYQSEVLVYNSDKDNHRYNSLLNTIIEHCVNSNETNGTSTTTNNTTKTITTTNITATITTTTTTTANTNTTAKATRLLLRSLVSSKDPMYWI